MSRSMALTIEVCCILVGLLFFALGKLGFEVFYIPSAIVLVGAMILNLIFNRCPNCGRFLGRHHWFIEYCPYCGGWL